ncbi:MAG: DUF5110 domain-containing protein [Verrucomicrobia bacterium]|nr:MAG: DUF5110 domain-containing protein [Verrucomicrobiota bacterium]
MKAPKPIPTVPCRHLRVLAVGNRDCVLRNSAVTAVVSVLAPDLFRIRISRGRSLPAAPSWAVDRDEWPACEATVRASKTHVEIATAAGRLRWSLRDGAWTLRDRVGLPVFSAGAGATGFAGDEARVDLDLADGEKLFGLGETTGPIDKRGLVREFWNTDVLAHSPAIHPGMRSLYISIPFVLSMREGRAAGLFWDNPRRQTWDLGQSKPGAARLKAAAGEIDLYLFLGPTPAAVVGRYTELTGRIPMPPRWALGYQQCRYSYETGTEFEAVARHFRRRKIPCDVLYLDIHHMDGYRVFTFGKDFPDAKGMIARLARRGFKVAAIVDPGVKNDPKFGVLRRGTAAGAFVRNADGGGDFLGEAWPGEARFPDFLNAAARDWWGDEQKVLLDAGVAAVWNDMNEPANFGRPDKTLAPDALHATDHGPARHEEVHNLYGMQMSRASREGALRHRPDERPFVITRATYAGGQRHAIVWTGDNSSCWEHLADSIQMLLNLGLSGVAFCGGDVGGFLDNATPELLVRWMQFAAFTPFFRNHSNLGTVHQEPWAFGEATEDICRTWIGLRYQFLPTWYALVAEAHKTGAPPMRPLLWHYPNDPVAVACGDQFLVGPNLLVAPVTRQGCAARAVYLPNDLWFDFWTGERHEGGRHVLARTPMDRIPVFVRAGSLLALADTRQHLDGKGDATVTLHAWPGPRGELEWYEDDGTSRAHERGGAMTRTLVQSTRGRTLRIDFQPEAGDFPSAVRTWRVVVWGARRPAPVLVDGRPIPASFADDAGVLIAEIPNSPGAFRFEFKGV